MQLEMGLSQLRASVDADEVLFWGKINGINADYFIAVAVTFRDTYEFPTKSFYWTLSTTPDFKFKEMPSLGLPIPEQDAFIDNCATYFLGEPSKLLNQKEGEENAEDEPAEPEPAEDEEGEGNEEKAKNSDESEDEEIKVPKRNLTELNRLAVVVNAIENDCQICPVGAFKMTSKHELRRAEAFRGLNKDQAFSLENYLHFRNVQTAEKKAILEQSDAPFRTDILEPVTADLPRGCWSIQKDGTGTTVLIRSLSWPGFQFFHRINSNKFGNVYIGDGLKDREVQFLVQ